LRTRPGTTKLFAMRCLIVDDSTEFLTSALLLLESQGMEIVACASSRAEALQFARALRPDVFLVDVELGEEDGVALTHELAELLPSANIVLISAYEVEDLDDLISGSGAAGFLPKSALGAAAIEALAG
jgi:DNA-binding NarL/FixJ family response regulator